MKENTARECFYWKRFCWSPQELGSLAHCDFVLEHYFSLKVRKTRESAGEELALEIEAVSIKLICVVTAYAILVCYFSSLLCT